MSIKNLLTQLTMGAGRPRCWRYKKRKWVAALPRLDKDIRLRPNHNFLTEYLAGPNAATANQRSGQDTILIYLGLK